MVELPKLIPFKHVLVHVDRPKVWGLFLGWYYPNISGKVAEVFTLDGREIDIPKPKVRLRRIQRFEVQANLRNHTPWLPTPEEIKARAEEIRLNRAEPFSGAGMKPQLDRSQQAQRECPGCGVVFMSINPKTNHYCPGCQKTMNSAPSIPEWCRERHVERRSLDEDEMNGTTLKDLS